LTKKPETLLLKWQEASRIMEYTAVITVIIILNRGYGYKYFLDPADYTNLCTTTLAA
jgi:hypothetical protein